MSDRQVWTDLDSNRAASREEQEAVCCGRAQRHEKHPHGPVEVVDLPGYRV